MKPLIRFLTAGVMPRAKAVGVVLVLLYSTVLAIAGWQSRRSEASDTATIVLRKSGEYTFLELEHEIANQAQREVWFDQKIRDESLYVSAGEYDVNRLIFAVARACQLEVRKVGDILFLTVSNMTFAPGDEIAKTAREISSEITRYHALRIPFREERFEVPWVDFQELTDAEQATVLQKLMRTMALEVINKRLNTERRGGRIELDDDTPINMPPSMEQALHRQAVILLGEGMLKFRQEFVLSLDTYIKSDRGYVPQNRFSVRLRGQGPSWKEEIPWINERRPVK
jgi:hypothetical protein